MKAKPAAYVAGASLDAAAAHPRTASAKLRPSGKAAKAGAPRTAAQPRPRTSGAPADPKRSRRIQFIPPLGPIGPIAAPPPALVPLNPQFPRIWRAYQRSADDHLKEFGIFILLWRRQAGKTEVLSAWALETLFQKPGETVILASASLNVGGEVALRAAGVFWLVLARMRERSRAFEATAVEPGAEPRLLADFDALKDAFVDGKLEVRFTHPEDRGVSRLKVLAPNPATARGFSGTVFLDEIGFIPNFREVWDAVEPITSSDPSFRLIMCTTPPADTSHYAHELIVPPAGFDFETTEPAGAWYRSEAGLMVHRVDAWDAHAAGAVLFHPETREPLTTDGHRALALDKEAWDRNYGLRLATTGTAAIALNVLSHAQNRPEAARCVFLEGELPADWREQLGEIREPVTVGFDVATTEKETSNPSALTILEFADGLHLARLIFRWKTSDPKVSTGYVREIVSTLRTRRLVIDASNERFYARQVRDELSRHCPVELVVSSENITVGGDELPLKTYLGNLVVNALDDGRLVLPAHRTVQQDFRLVRKQRGRFDNEVDASGNHGDTFDSTKLALHGWLTPAAGAFTAETLAQVLTPARPSLPLLRRPLLTVSFS